MKRKLLLAATSLMLAVVGGGGSASAYTVDDLVTAGWTKVTASPITGTADNYYMLVDVNSFAYVMSNDASHYRPCYKTIDDPVANPSFVWILEGSDNTFALKSYSTGSYFIQVNGWDTSMNGATGSTTFNFALSEGKYSLNAVGRTDFVGHWNDDGAAVANDGENIAANKQAGNAPGFLLYSISKATYDAALIAARKTATAGATEANPVDVTAWIQNADWSGDWGGWARSGSWGNQQWGLKTLESWNATNVIVKQELKGVPNGKYKVSADLISGPGAAKAAYVFGTGSSKVSSIVVSAEASADNYTTMSNEVAGNTLTADNVIVTGNTITLGIDQSTGWIVADNFKLYYYGVDLTALKNSYNEALTTAKGYEDDLFDEDWATLSNAIFENTLNLDNATEEDLNTAIANLTEANGVAAAAATRYATYNTAVATIGDGTSETNLTNLIGNPSFESTAAYALVSDGWINEGVGLQGQTNAGFEGYRVGNVFAERWANNTPIGAFKTYQTIDALPAGLYRVSAVATFNGTGASLIANNTTTAITDAGAYSLLVQISDKGSIELGVQAVNPSGSWFKADNFTLTYLADFPAYTLATGKMGTDKSAAQASAEEAYLADKTVANYNALLAAITEAEASVANYAALKAAIDKANSEKEANNFVTAAATTTFEGVIETATTAWNDVTYTDQQAKDAVGTLKDATCTYMGSAWITPNPKPDVWWYFNTWSTEGDTDGTNFFNPFFENFKGNTDNLPNNTFTASLSGLDNGRYEVEIWARVQRRTDADFNADNSMITMYVNDGDAVSIMNGSTIINENANNTMRLGRFTAVGDVTDGTLTLSINVKLGSNVHWLSWRDVKYTKLDEASMSITAAKYATFCAPFDVTIPTDVTAYTVDGVEKDGTTLKTTVVETTIPANTPVLLYNSGATDFNDTFYGKAVEGDKTEGLLTGVYSGDTFPGNAYVLQTQDGVQAFYYYDGSDLTITPNRAYLKLSNGEAKERVLFLENEDATLISVISALTTGEVDAIYSVGGTPLNGLQKGINIVKMRNGETKKVILK